MNAIVICDDMEVDRKKLIELLEKQINYEEGPCEIYEYASAEEVIEDFVKCKTALMCFIDIYMNQMNGVELAKIMRQRGYEGEIIFTTTSTEFVMESYDLNALYYLVKPYTVEKVSQVRKRYQKLVEAKERDREAYLIVKSGTAYRKIKYSDIEYIESKNTMLNIHLTNGDDLTLYEKLSNLEEKLQASCFLRCHQSYLVNMDHVVKAEDAFLMESGNVALIRQKELHLMKEKYFSYTVKKIF